MFGYPGKGYLSASQGSITTMTKLEVQLLLHQGRRISEHSKSSVCQGYHSMRLPATGPANTPGYHCGLLPECLISGVGFDCVQNRTQVKGEQRGFLRDLLSVLSPNHAFKQSGQH